MRKLILTFCLFATIALAQTATERIGAANTYCTSTSLTDTYSCNLSSTPSAYVTGALYSFKAATANTGAATINFNSKGAKTIVKVVGGVTTALADNDIRVGQVVMLEYDGTNMQMQSTLGNAATGTGDVVGPGSATDNAIARFDSTTGKLIQNSSATVDDSGNVAALSYSSGASPPSVTPGTAGGDAYAEGTVPSVCVAAGVDCIYADSTSHTIKASYNNGTYYDFARVIYAGTKALDTDAIASEGCDSMTQAATGTLSTDVINYVPNADITAVTGYAPETTGGLAIYVWPSADTINIKVCNPSSGSITPGAVSLNLQVIRK